MLTHTYHRLMMFYPQHDYRLYDYITDDFGNAVKLTSAHYGLIDYFMDDQFQ